MFRRRSESNESNFWISYADLMAGLLFVFILLIGAIVSKSMILREDLYAQKEKLGQTEVSLMEKMDKLGIVQDKLRDLTSELNSREAILRDVNNSLVSSKLKLAEQKNVIRSDKERIALQKAAMDKDDKLIDKQKETIKQEKHTVSEQKSIIKKDKEVIAKHEETIVQDKKVITKQVKTITYQEEKIQLQAEEVKKLHRLLAGLESSVKLMETQKQTLGSKIAGMTIEIDSANSKLLNQKELARMKEEKISHLQSLITLTKDSLKLKGDDLEKLNQLLLARNSKVDTLSKKVILLQNLIKETSTTLEEKQKKLQEYVGKVIVLSNNLTDKEDELALKDKKLANLLENLDQKRTIYDDLVAKLQSQKAKIKSLTGIKLKVIAALKETLGDKINIDRKSGALRLSSNILFDRGSSELRDASKAELQKAFEEYIGALVSDMAIRPHLDRIVIEGHTDSDGAYLFNLELSQQRALAVMNYLLTLQIATKYNLKKYLVASGRAYLDNISQNGVEDKEASRRIEIKFQLKNQDAMHEIERILDDGKQLF